MGNRPKRRTPRAVRTDVWRRPIADPSEAAAALDEARGRLVLASIGVDVDPAALAPLEEAVRTAQAAVDACFEEITLHALPGAQFEALMAEHPPAEADVEKELVHNDETFLPALLAACCENGWLEEDWVEEIAELSVGERSELREIVTHVNTRTWSQQIPKG
jgi:hypothetical protein